MRSKIPSYDHVRKPTFLSDGPLGSKMRILSGLRYFCTSILAVSQISGRTALPSQLWKIDVQKYLGLSGKFEFQTLTAIFGLEWHKINRCPS